MYCFLRLTKMQMNNGTAGNRETPSKFPCGACKINKKKCSDKCVLAPYFPLDDPQKFLLVNKVFGHGRVIKLLRDVPAEQRGDAVISMVYEASQRVRDPVHGCFGVINDLHKQLAELQARLDSTQAQLANMSMQYANLLNLVTEYHEVLATPIYDASLQEREDTHKNPHVLDDLVDPMQLWEPFLT